MSTSWKTQRLMVGLTQAELARKSGVIRRKISLIERGVCRPTPAETESLIAVLAYPATPEIKKVSLQSQLIKKLPDLMPRLKP